MSSKNYLEYILNPFDLLRTKKVLHVNPTIIPERKDSTQSVIMFYEYTPQNLQSFKFNSVEDCFPFLQTDSKHGLMWMG